MLTAFGRKARSDDCFNKIFLYLKSLATVVLSVFGIVSSFCVFAQDVGNDSLIQLNEVVITNTRLQNYATGHFIQNVDTATSRYAVASNAAELLRKFGFGHIRSYGIGGLTTPSFRGTGASHTAVLWNGINIISPLNGQSDLSLLPVTFIDDVQLQSGGSASLYGAGAIGGTIQFNNKAMFRQGLNVSLTENIGSFKTLFHGLSVSFSAKRWITSTKVFQSGAKNDFPYINNNYATPKRERRRHNAYEQHGVLQQNYFQVNSRQLLSLRFWYQDNYYEVPQPTSVPREGVSTQRDRFFRSMIGWNYDYKNGHTFVQSAYVHHLLDYRDPSINLESASTFDSFISTVENTVVVAKDLEWTSGGNYTLESAGATEIGNGDARRNRLSLYTAFKHRPGKWTNVLSSRQEIVNGKPTPFAPSLGADYSLHRVFSFFGNLSRNYRIPTFNDLYWSDALAKGNPFLKMETSWSEEIGARIGTKYVRGQIAFFSNQVADLIYWVPVAGIWSPDNVRNAWTRGIETTGTVGKTFGKISSEITARYSYTVATAEGRQLVYTPKHESGTTLRIGWRKWSLSVTDTYTGLQYTDDSNSSYQALRPYNILNIWISKDLTIRRMTILIMTEIDNLTDNQASTRPGYPLPGRNFKAGITIRFNKQPQS
jgi:iron complex outermembrane receptor protein